MPDIDFGLYHHSTKEQSEDLRKIARTMFMEAFKKIGIPEDAKIIILDAGAGSGFLTYTAASYFHNANITAIDNFTDKSLEGNSIDRIKENMEKLGIYDRVKILEKDLMKPIDTGRVFDLAISNIVLHNLGKSRFTAYKNISKTIKCNRYFINADGFIRKNIFVDPFRKDMNKISNFFNPNFAMEPNYQNKSASWRYILVGLKTLCPEK